MARHGTARVRREDETLSFVDQSLLSHIRANPGCRAVDIAAHFQLNRSTVSRQLGALAEFGLIATTDPDTDRGHVLVATDRGRASLGRAAGSVRAALDEHLAEWSLDELTTFAASRLSLPRSHLPEMIRQRHRRFRPVSRRCKVKQTRCLPFTAPSEALAASVSYYSGQSHNGAWHGSSTVSTTGNAAEAEFYPSTVTVDNGQSATSGQGAASQTYTRRREAVPCSSSSRPFVRAGIHPAAACTSIAQRDRRHDHRSCH
ncbi:MarR family winged helix-turn-helix transcriptional regulator [Leifsonia sp. LS1]|uniref:MarR family winged helix-turn-helix transcriptional regulator n=1 Tax=Leifsonia sp. LS1 TaxID=2828483 RepID=UPI001CFEF5D6|nr:MarR family winged helix-turn-helix transcriptional regulator [Leifsonia sp. LS1]